MTTFRKQYRKPELIRRGSLTEVAFLYLRDAA